jgi:hypothetical protein
MNTFSPPLFFEDEALWQVSTPPSQVHEIMSEHKEPGPTFKPTVGTATSARPKRLRASKRANTLTATLPIFSAEGSAGARGLTENLLNVLQLVQSNKPQLGHSFVWGSSKCYQTTRVRYARHRVGMGELKIHTKFQSENLKRRRINIKRDIK